MQRRIDPRRTGLRPSRVAWAIIGALFLPATVHAVGPDPDPDRVITYTADIAPIFQQNCQVCHQPGAVGPMSLTTYEEVRPWAQVIKLRVENQEMPPYHYDVDVGIQELKHDRRLSAEQIATIAAWVDQGAVMGDPADMPEPVTWPDKSEFRLASELGPPDVILKSDPYSVPPTGSDLWWRPLVPTGFTQDRCIRAIETKPSPDGWSVTHHANSTFEVIEENGDRRQVARLSEYAQGKLGEIVPVGTFRIASADSYVSWDIHYYPTGEEATDNQVEIGLWLYPEEEEPKFEQTLALYGQDGDIDIAPHGKAVVQGFHTFDHPVRIDSWQPHGHLRMTGAAIEVLYPTTGKREVVSMISNWTNDWHLSHLYEEHAAPLLPAGTVIILTSWYDNTLDNPRNPDPDQWVGKGSRAADEMAHSWIAVTHLDEAEFERLSAEREANNAATAAATN